MKAFTGTKVSKDQLLASLRKHREQDDFQPGHYWQEYTGTGCGVGCSIHDFAPGEERDHDQFEGLFGIPAELAVLEDDIFEHLHSEKHRQEWPLEFILAVPVGADLDKAAGRWMLLLLTSGESPFYEERHRPHVQAARHLLHAWIETGATDGQAASKLETALAQAAPEADLYTMHATDMMLHYVRCRCSEQPYTIHDMQTLAEIRHQATLQHSEAHGPTAHPDFRDAASEATHRVSRLLLQAITGQQ